MPTSDVDIEGLLGTAAGELKRRLDEKPEEFPAHVLSRIFDHAVRLKKEEDEPISDEEQRGLLDWIEEAGLPRERKLELLKEEILRLEEQTGRAYELLRGLEDDDRTGEAGSPREPGSLHSEVLP